MKITTEELENIFRQVINGKISREKANDIAFHLKKSYDENNLIISPNSLKEYIWTNGIMYLYGIDMIDSNGQYIHSIEDIKNQFDQFRNTIKQLE